MERVQPGTAALRRAALMNRRVRPAGQIPFGAFGRVPTPDQLAADQAAALKAQPRIDYSILRPGTPATADCTLPTNPILGQTSVDANGVSYRSVDPYFASQAVRDAWASSHPTCTAPPFLSPQVSGPPAAPSIPGWVWGAGAAVLAVGIGAAVVMMRPKARGSRRSR